MLQVEPYPQPAPPAPHLTGGPTLYSLADDLVSLLDLREDMAENKEGTEAVDAAIAEYMAALPTKVDGVVHVIRTLDSQAELAAAEVQRLAARRRRIASAAERLRQYCCDVLAKLPAPKKGSRKLEGSTSSLVLKTNGGVLSMDVYESSLIPDECCTATVTMPFPEWKELVNRACTSDGDFDHFYGYAKRQPNEKAVREALNAPCWVCDGTGQSHSITTDCGSLAASSEACASCGGSGKCGVPGAKLLERGAHLEIR